MAHGISIRNLIAGFYSTKIRKGAAVNYLAGRRFVRQIVQILQNINSKHQFQVVWFIPAFSLIGSAAL